jgi:hypothetical protein
LSIICRKSKEDQGSQQPQKRGKSESDPEQSAWIGHGKAELRATLLIESCHPATPVPKETDEQLLSALDDSGSINPRPERRSTCTRKSDNFHTSYKDCCIPSSPKLRAKKIEPLEDANEYKPIPTFCSHIRLVLLWMGPPRPTNRKANPYICG